MNMTTPFKPVALISGIVCMQAGLFACYVANVWRHPIALWLIALIPVCMLVFTYQRERNWFKAASSVTGTVISRQKANRFGQAWQVLTVAYTIHTIAYTYAILCSPYAPVPAVGESVHLFYQPNKPADAREHARFLDRIAPYVALTLGAIGLVIIALNDSDTLLSLTSL